MLHARTAATDDQDTGEPTGLDPDSRGGISPPAPFDFASERTWSSREAPAEN